MAGATIDNSTKEPSDSFLMSCSDPSLVACLQNRMTSVEKGEGLRRYYQSKIDELSVKLQDKSQNLKRLEAQRNELNAQGT